MTEKKTPVKAQEKAVVKWKGEQITVSFHDVKTLICPYATDQEAAVFLKTCQSLQLNPFAKEIYLIKYSEGDKAAMVIAIDSYLKSAESNANFNGHEAGIVLKDSGGKLEFREGSLLLPDEAEKLVGGYARVYRTDREKSFYMAVNKAECLRYTRDGTLTKFWAKEKQPSMLRKTALKRALVEAFPSLFAGTMSTAEVAEDSEAEYHEIPEGELPPAYEKNGEAYWSKWWARQKEKGLSEDDVHGFLGVASVKEDWIGQGRTLEEAEDIINNALEKRAKPKAEKPKAKAQPAAPPVAEAPGEELFSEEAATKPTETPKPKRAPESIKNIAQLYSACFEDFKLQPKDVLKELGYISQTDISETAAECYRRIAAVR
ncbi:MAG TPA: RecT family recombinase [Dehalococcoidia bacterium]|nr:RecT family recombinase [Dehalococcoidia bacterium]